MIVLVAVAAIMGVIGAEASLAGASVGVVTRHNNGDLFTVHGEYDV